VQGENLAEAVGLVLSAERNRAQLSQAQLAERVGVSQQWLSRIERGRVNASLATVQRLFAVLGRQLRVEAVPLRADMDIDIDRGLALAEEQRAQDIGLHRILLDRLRGIPYAIAGRLAAFAQGAPMGSPSWIDIVVSIEDLDALADVMAKSSCMRWSAKWEDWGYGSTDPREPGLRRWKLGLSDMRLHIVDELPPTIDVRVGKHVLRVVPIAEIEREDPWLRRLMTRWRVRAKIDV
jgi:transcriptional regulator with XRE-family HTH domain